MCEFVDVSIRARIRRGTLFRVSCDVPARVGLGAVDVRVARIGKWDERATKELLLGECCR